MIEKKKKKKMQTKASRLKEFMSTVANSLYLWIVDEKNSLVWNSELQLLLMLFCEIIIEP